MFKRLLTVSGFTALSRVTGFVTNIVAAYVMGDGMVSDAFWSAFRFPNSFRNIFGEGAFNAAFLPRFTKIVNLDGPEAAAQFADEVYSWQIIVQLVLLVAALAGMRYVMLAMGLAGRPAELTLATAFGRICFPYLIMTVSSVQLSAMLNAVGKFAAAAAWSIFLNLAMIAALLFAHWFPNAGYAAACGVLAGGALQLGFIAWAAARSHMRLHIRLPRWTPRVKEFLLALGAATVGSASVQINLLIDTLISNLLPVGVLTAVNYADRIDQLPLGVLGIALATVLLPEMSERVARGDEAGARTAQNRSAAIALFLTLPFAAAFLVVPQTIMRGIFVHGAFHVDAADTSALALAGYGVGLPAFVLARLLTSTFYARHDTATPVRATWTAVAVNVGLKMLLVLGLHMGALGVALGTSLGSWASVSVLFWLGRRRKLINIDDTLRRSLLPSVIGASVTAATALVGVMWASKLVPAPGMWQRELALALAILLAGIGFAAVALIFRRRLLFERFAKKR
ncbi:MAG: murein biosynthesis integral membrane protein MurJ [Alphaproteobacteria bacterium]|nr:murein biosynthesis integral membrane protein MurJ [Alphaproteobacteria bacterium]MDE2110936.1 murein biosynthesis integral membrane protein MurJ [Alphaproteobacteria bacterium]MDE2495419.1 murein biosynthesis integral membrane protein MurJ [Alphaproteobacteria bacterium]